MTGSNYWGEERYPDAVYSVYLKKIRYVPPPKINDGNQQDNTAVEPSFVETSDHLQWETIRERVIKAGTLRKLVESLVDSEGQLDSRQFNIFFATYRAFAQTEEVLEQIIQWYLTLDTRPSSLNHAERLLAIRSTIKSILICWLDIYSEDFYVINQTEESISEFILLDKLHKFSKSENLHDLRHKTKKLKDKFRRIQQHGGLLAQIPSIARISFAITGFDPNLPTISPNTSKSQFELNDDERYAKMLDDAQSRAQMFDVACGNVPQIAEQLTFWDALLFRELKAYQCQGSIWGKRNKIRPELVYSVRATIDQFNALCQRVMTSIVLPECQPQFRSTIIEKWIHIAKELNLLNNNSSLKAVISSLQSQPVFRLKNTWSLVSKACMIHFNELSKQFNTNPEEDKNGTELFNPSKTTKLSPRKSPSGTNCRRTKSDINIALETQGNVPYLGTFLTELQMIDQAFPDETEDSLINFEKRRQEFEILAKLRLYQSAALAYMIPMDQAFCVWFNFLPALDEKECFIRSVEIEPNNNDTSTPDTRRKAREGIPQMPKIHSLSKIFSGLGHSKEFSPLGNSYFFGNEQQQLRNYSEKRNSFDVSSMDKSSPAADSSLGSSTQFTEKPPKGQRSRSQGAKKDTRCKQNSMKGLTRIQGLSPSSPQWKKDYGSSELNFQHAFSSSGSEFNPKKHFASNSPQNKTKNSAMTGSFDFINNHLRQNSGRRINEKECLNDLVDSPSDSIPTTSASSHGQHMMAQQQATNRNGDFKEFTPADNGQYLTHKNHKDLLERTKQFQMSTSSSSSRSSLGNNQKYFGGASPSSISVSNCPREEQNFHLIRVALDDALQQEYQITTTTNYKCIKVINGDRMPQVIQRALEKHMIDTNDSPNYCLIQLLPDGGEFRLPDSCNPFYAIAPDPTSPILNCILRKRNNCSNSSEHNSIPDSKKLSKEKRNNLLRWSSGFL